VRISGEPVNIYMKRIRPTYTEVFNFCVLDGQYNSLNSVKIMSPKTYPKRQQGHFMQ